MPTRHASSVEMPHSKSRKHCRYFEARGYISDFAVEGKLPRTIKMKLKYQGKKSVIEGLNGFSTPGLRRYVGSTEIPRVRGGLGVSMLSTIRRHHDRHSGPQKKPRRRTHLLCLVKGFMKHWNFEIIGIPEECFSLLSSIPPIHPSTNPFFKPCRALENNRLSFRPR